MCSRCTEFDGRWHCKESSGPGHPNTVGHLMLGLAPVQHAMADKMSEMSVGYPKSPLNGQALSGGPKPGARIAPIAGQTPVGSGTSPRFALFATSSAAAAGLIERFSTLLDPASVRRSGRMDYGRRGPTVTLLARPRAATRQ